MRVLDSISFPQDSGITDKTVSPGARKPESEVSSAGAGEDVTELSADSQKVQQLKSQLADLPDIRQDKVQQLQQQIKDGTYEVSANKIADAMLADLGSD